MKKFREFITEGKMITIEYNAEGMETSVIEKGAKENKIKLKKLSDGNYKAIGSKKDLRKFLQLDIEGDYAYGMDDEDIDDNYPELV